jgi:hypothetical protein
MLALVSAAETYVARHDRDFTTVWALAWKLSGQAARREGGRTEVLCLGDSLVKYGVAPRIIEALTGLRAYNLAVYNGQAPTNYFLLRRALDSRGRPEAVLIDGEVLDQDPRTHARMWGDLLSFRESIELAWAARDASFFGSISLARLLPSCKARFEMRAGIRAALRGETASSRPALRVHLRNWEQNHGAHLAPADPSAQETIRRAIATSEYLPTCWTCHPINEVFARRLLELTEARHLRVFWLLPPLHPDVQERRDRGGMHGQYVAFIRRLQAEFPCLTVIDGRHSGYAPDALADLTHLNRVGAAHFSAEVAAVLRARIAGEPLARWIELPRVRGPVAEVPLEDLEQSQIAMQALRTRRVR